MSVAEWDVLVLGCGSAGSRAARAAADAGARTLVVDDSDELGGLCILRGCMPTKTLLETAHRMHDIRDAARFGIEATDPRVNFGAMMERVRTLVARFQRAKVASIEGGDYALLRGTPRFFDRHTVTVDGDLYRAKAIVIATGSKARPMSDVGAARVLTSDDVFELEELPESVLVVGGGAVALEFATWFARIGTKVTLANRSNLLWRTDPELGVELTRSLADEMEIVIPSTVSELSVDAEGRTVVELRRGEESGGESIVRRVDFVLNATGRVPRFDGLDLQKADIEMEDGNVAVTKTLRVDGCQHVFLAGDVSGLHGILHEANREGTLAGRNAARVARGAVEELEEFDYSVPPVEVIFCDPPYATTGLRPLECEVAGIPYVQAEKRFSEQGRGIVVGARHGFVRLLAHRDTRRILGCQMLGPRADDLIQIVSSVLTMGGTATDMNRVPWYHPTLAEAFIEVSRELSR